MRPSPWRLALWLFLAAAVVAAVAIPAALKIRRDRSVAELAAEASEAKADGRLGDAVSLYAAYLRERPGDAAARTVFAELLFELSSLPGTSSRTVQATLDAINAALLRNPDSLPLRGKFVITLLRLGQSDAAQREVGALRKQWNASPEAARAAAGFDADQLTLLEANACLGNENVPEALALAGTLIGYEPDTKAFGAEPKDTRTFAPASLLVASILSDKLQDRDTAERVLERLERMPTGEPGDLLSLAQWHATHGDMDRASKAVERAAALAPDNPAVLSTRVTMAISARRWDEAEGLATKIRELFPKSPEGDLGLATVAVQRGDAAAAIDLLQQAVVRLPDNPQLLFALADAQLAARLPDEAEKTIAELVKKLGAESIQLGMLESRLLMVRRQWMPAVKRLDALRPLAAQAADQRRQIDLLLADCHAALGQPDEQIAASRRAAEAAPGSVSARVSEAASLAASGRTEDALVEFERLAAAVGDEALPKRPDVWRPLLQLRATRQLRRPPADRDWSKVTGLIDALGRAEAVSPAALAAMRYDQLLAAGDRTAAADALARALAAHGDEPELWERSVVAAATSGGHAAAERAWKEVPAAVADDPRLLAMRAQLALRAPPEEAPGILAGLESKAASLPPEGAARLLAAVANSRLAAGDQAGAEATLREVIKRTPEDLQARLAIFELACDRRDLAKARAAAEDISAVCGASSATSRAVAAATLLLEVTTTGAAGIGQSGGPPPAAGPEFATRLDAARNMLVEAEQERPGWPLIQRLLANVESLRGDGPAAIARLRKAVELGDRNPLLVRRLVAMLTESGRHDDAREVLDLLGVDPPLGFERLSAEVDIRAGRAGEAIAQAERSLASGQTIPPPDLVWFGQLLARAGKPDRAVEALDRATRADPREPQAWLTLIGLQVAVGDRPAAEGTLERAVKNLQPPARQLCLARGQALLGRTSAAERTFQEAIAAHPDAVELQVGLAELLVGAGRSTEADEALRAILSATSVTEAPRRWARRTLVELAARQGSHREVEQALVELERNTDNDGRMSTDDLLLAIGLLANRPEPVSWRRALDFINSLAARRELSVTERLQRADLLDRIGRWDDAKRELLPLAGDASATPTVLAAVIDKLIRHGEPELATGPMKVLASRQPAAATVLALEARLAMARDDRQAAIEALRRLSTDTSGKAVDPQALRMAAALMEKLGFDKAADRTLARLASQSPGDAVAHAVFLGRQGRTGEAIDLLAGLRERLEPAEFLPAALAVLRASGKAATDEQAAVVDTWFEDSLPKIADAVGAALMQAELDSLRSRREEAVAGYRKLLAGDGLSRQQRAIVKNNLAMLLARPETAAEAKRLIGEAIAEQGPHPSLLDTQGVVLLAAGDNGEAVAALREAVLEPSPEKYLHLARALAAWEEPDDARKALREARKLGLEPRRLDRDDRERLESVEKALGIDPAKS